MACKLEYNARMKLFAFGLCAALLAACASTPVTPSQPRPAQAVEGYRDTFEATGRLTVNYLKDGNPESLSGKFNWSQVPGRVDVSLSSPMSTIATISITPESATLVQADQVP